MNRDTSSNARPDQRVLPQSESSNQLNALGINSQGSSLSVQTNPSSLPAISNQDNLHAVSPSASPEISTFNTGNAPLATTINIEPIQNTINSTNNGRRKSVFDPSFSLQDTATDSNKFNQVSENKTAELNGHLQSLELILNSVVKIFCTSTTPHYSMPWQMKRQCASTSSGFVIKNRMILGNAHGATNASSIRIRKHGDAHKYTARVIHMAHEADLVILTVDNEKFWQGLEPLTFGKVPQLQESVTVVGYPTGGDNLSVTKGVVSRVVVSTYTHSGETLLSIQIDAAINPGNSGGPAMQGREVVGVAFEALSQAQSIGYIIPVPVIEHVLRDIELNGRYTGFPRLAFNWQKLENESLREYYNIPNDKHGVLVHSVEPLDHCASVLQKGDVITKVDDVDVADDGTIYFRRGERLSFRFLESSKFVGDEIKLTIVRQGQELTANCKLSQRLSLVPLHLHDKLPQYLIYGGLVFTVLSRAYLYHEWGKDWHKKASVDLVSLAYYGVMDEPDKQVVILSQILVDDINNGYPSAFHNLILQTVNGQEIKNIKGLSSIMDSELSKGVDFFRFGLDRDRILILSTKQAKEAEDRILKQNQIPFPQSPDLRSSM